MKEFNIWEFGERVNVKVKETFLKEIKTKIFNRYKTKRNTYNQIKNNPSVSFKTFSNLLKENYNKKFFIPLGIWLNLCRITDVNFYYFQKNIEAYKASNGPNFISKPILPVKVTPVFDMIIAHNIADGTVIDPKKGRLPYFGYRQFDPLFRELYIRKLESIFGKINFPIDYYFNTTRPYCPPVLAYLFFKNYDLNTTSFLSKSARIPKKILEKNKEHLLAVLIAFIIDEGNIDSTAIVIKLANPDLTNDLFKICKILSYKSTFSISGNYGNLYILREGMKKLFIDYKQIIKKYPEITLGKWETKIENGFKIYNRPIYKTKGNKDIMLIMLKNEDLTVNQIAQRINMTRQGVRFHIHNLEKEGAIIKNGFTGYKNIVYRYGGG